MKNRKAYIEAIVTVMSTDDALGGIHIDMIAQRLVMSGLPAVQGMGYDELRALANRLILSDCRRGGGLFLKVRDSRRGTARRGMYMLAGEDETG